MKKFTLTREQFEILRDKLAAQGHPITGDSGAIEASGVRLQCSYSDLEQTLTVNIAHKPMFVPESLVWSKIDGWISPA